MRIRIRLILALLLMGFILEVIGIFSILAIDNMLDISKRDPFDSNEFESFYSKTRNSLLIFIVTGMVVSIWLGFAISHYLVKPIEQLTKTIENISEGRLDVEVMEKDRNDEIGMLARAFDRTLVSLKIAMKKIGFEKK